MQPLNTTQQNDAQGVFQPVALWLCSDLWAKTIQLLHSSFEP